MLKRSTLATMRLAMVAAATAAALAGCGKETKPKAIPAAARVPTAPDDEGDLTPLAGKPKPDAGPRPDPCPACGMG